MATRFEKQASEPGSRTEAHYEECSSWTKTRRTNCASSRGMAARSAKTLWRCANTATLTVMLLRQAAMESRRLGRAESIRQLKRRRPKYERSMIILFSTTRSSARASSARWSKPNLPLIWPETSTGKASRQRSSLMLTSQRKYLRARSTTRKTLPKRISRWSSRR